MSANSTSAFQRIVEREFAFLPALGIKLTESKPTRVQFESPFVCITVYHGRQSSELGLEIGPAIKEGTGAYYSMGAVMRLVEPDRADRYRNYVALDVEQIEKGICGLASLFHSYIRAGLLDDPLLFSRLKAQREERNRAFALSVTLAQVREKLQASWHGKDYTKVVELLLPFKDHLTESERRKLLYAQRQITH
jgi:hypothetical protein